MQTTYTRPPDRYWADSAHVPLWASVVAPVAVFVALLTAAVIAPEWTDRMIVREGFGAMEMAHFLMPLAAAIIAMTLLRRPLVRADRLLFAFCALFALGGIYWAGEEVSWGQHFFGWLTPDGLLKLNDQQETNLHNIGSWADQKPRLILVLGIGIGGLVGVWALLNRPYVMPVRFDVLYPPLWLVPVALMVVGTEAFQHVSIPGFEAELNLLRPGEIQELYIAWYVLGYALTLRRRVA